MTESLSSHTVSLARELLDDIELSRLPPEQLLLKTSSLARLLGDKHAQTWIASSWMAIPGPTKHWRSRTGSGASRTSRKGSVTGSRWQESRA